MKYNKRQSEQSEKNFDNFDEFAQDYRSIHNKNIKISGADSDYFSEYKIVELLQHESHFAPIKILDFGCGDGNSVVYLKKHFPHSSVFGVDVSEKSILLAQSKKISSTEFLHFNGSSLPFENNSFDVVFSSMVFHHIEHQLHLDIINEISRVLKPNGRFYNFEHNPLNPLTQKIVKECEFDKDARLLSPKYHKALITKSDLQLKEVRFTLFFPRHKLFNMLLPLEKRLSKFTFGAQYYIIALKDS